MAINKNFVVKNGFEVDGNLIFADADSNKVGILTTAPQYDLDVNGELGTVTLISQNTNLTGIATVNNVVIDGYVSIGETIGKPGQVLVSTGAGVTWSKLSKKSFLFTATEGQDTFPCNYTVGTAEVYVNGVRLAPDEFDGTDGTIVVLDTPCFGGETVEILASDTLPIGAIEVPIGITIRDEGVRIGSALSITDINFTGDGVVATADTGVSKVIVNVDRGITVQDEGSVVGSVFSTKTLNFIGDAITATTSGSGIVNVTVDSVITPPGKTVYVTLNGNDSNDGLTIDTAKRTIENAVGITSSGDTIKLTPGTYVENNPITLPENVAIEGAELRNCIVTPQNPDKDLFWVTNGTHLTDLSFQGQTATNGAAVIAFKPLVGVASDRFFDAARMIRYNLDYIAKEAVGFLTSTQYIGAGRTQVSDPVFEVVDGLGNPVSPSNCSDDIKDILKATIHDITRGGNSKCVGAGLSYYSGGALVHIAGTDVNGYSVKDATIDTIRYAADISRAVINNVTWGSNPVGVATTVTNALYDNVTGVTTITASNHGLAKDDAVKIVGLGFTCPSGPGIVTYPSGTYGYIFNVKSVIDSDIFEVVVGQSTLPHTYDSGGTVQKYENFQNEYTQLKDVSIQADSSTGFNNAINGCANVVSAIYSCVGVVTTIIGVGTTAVGTLFNRTYPGNSGIGTTNPNDPSFSSGVGNVTKGPYIRNCTNFIPESIGMKVDGFHAEPGDKDDIGITGMMSVDSYTQYNQGGIGVSITNGAYSQLVSIFTICDDIAIYSASGGQCDITNSNSSFGTKGLVSEGISDPTSKSIYRYTAGIHTNASETDTEVVLSGVGRERPYTGQVMYFGELYYQIESVTITNEGSGYTQPPTVTFATPTGPSNIIAEGFANISDNGSVTAVNLVGSGRNYRLTDNISEVTFSAPQSGIDTATGFANFRPIYYQVRSATLPSAGITTVTLATALNNDVGIGTTVFLSRQSLQIVSSHSFEYIGAGNTIELARPSKGGVTIQANEVIKIDGGEVVYTSTDQDGNFAIGEDLVIDQATGTIRGRAFERSLLNTVTPFIIALGAK